MEETNYKGYIPLSRNLIQNYQKYDITDEELCFLLKVMSYKYEQILTDAFLGYNRYKARRIRKLLKEKGIIKYFSTKGAGTIYYINIDRLIELNNTFQEDKPNEIEKAQEVKKYSIENIIILLSKAVESQFGIEDVKQKIELYKTLPKSEILDRLTFFSNRKHTVFNKDIPFDWYRD